MASGTSPALTYGFATNVKRDGNYAQFFARTDGAAFTGGVQQRLTVVPGKQYAIRAWMRRGGTATTQTMAFGYDPSGGLSAESPSVVWTPLEGAGLNTWTEYTATVTATGSSLTLFARGANVSGNGTNNYFYLDQVSVTPLN